MIKDEKKLAEALMNGEGKIELSDSLFLAVTKIRRPDEVVWVPIFMAIAIVVGYILTIGGVFALAIGGLPAILAVGGGIAATAFAVLGGKALLTAVKLSCYAKTADVLTKLRNDYDEAEEGAILIKK